jgi:release factor glutamine methyltransferase
MIYEPQEDSYMLAEEVKEYAHGKVLDIGTGSGIQGMTALKNGAVQNVLFSDINPECISHVKQSIKDKGDKRARFIVSDLFEKFNSKEIFDTIIFNPPYLPEDEYDKTIHNVGGKKGYEIIFKFLEKAKYHLSEDGTILLVFSSLSKKRNIDDKLKKDYVYELLSEKSFFMERLYVYKIEKKKTFKGHRGLVETINYRYQNRHQKKNIIAVLKYSRTEFYDAKKESDILKLLNKKGIGPRLYKYEKKNNTIIMEYIRGNRIIDFINAHEKKEIIDVIRKVLDQLTIMDDLKINKQEMTNPYKHIIIVGKKEGYEPVMIDFERAKKTDRPKNITQFIQFLTSGRLQFAFKEKNIIIDKKKLMDIAKSYKNNKNVNKDILECINSS